MSKAVLMGTMVVLLMASVEQHIEIDIFGAFAANSFL